MTVSSLTIKETSGKKRKLRLTGRALPHRPYALSGKQRFDLTWYPGSPEATIQVLGPEEEPTTIKGRWCDRFLSIVEDTGLVTDRVLTFATVDGRPLTEAWLLVEEVDDIRQLGQLLEVSWFTTQRTGIISRFTQTWLTAKDVEWEIEFTWTKQDLATTTPASIKETDLSEIAMRSTNRSDEVKSLSENSPFPQARDLADALKSVTGAVYDASRSMQANVLSVLDEVSNAMGAVRSVVGLLEYASDSYQRMNDALASTVDQAKQTKHAIDQVPVGEFCGIARWVRVMARANRRAAHEACRDRMRLLRMVDQDVVQVHYARDGQDLRSVSRMYYGSSDEWKRIAQFNHLTASKLRSGQVVLVPRVQKVA
jgi:hypothetical protein